MSLYKPRVKAPSPDVLQQMQTILQKHALTTVCEAAACPNRAECYERESATLMILGNTCTRKCAFCNVKTGAGEVVDKKEPQRVAHAVAEMALQYVVITSVDRDDLRDYGAGHFKRCVEAIKSVHPHIKIELLTPDFKYAKPSLEMIIDTKVYKLAHNQETVRSLSRSIRPQSDYDRSLRVLEYYAKHSNAIVKSSLMVGLGECEKELFQTMQDLLDVGVSELTLGQYLQPTRHHHQVVTYYPQEFFDMMKEEAYAMGFKAVASGALVRSSYFAEMLGDNYAKS